MKTTSKGFLAIGALLASSLAPAVAAQPAAPEPVEDSVESKPPEQMSPDHPHYASGYLFIGSDYANGKSSKEEVAARAAAMRANRNERRTNSQLGLKNRWGARLLVHPECRDELRLHARRLAYLTRAMFLAQTDASVKNGAPLAARIQGIIDKEEERHTKAMEGLRSMPPPATSVAPMSPSPSPSVQGGTK